MKDETNTKIKDAIKGKKRLSFRLARNLIKSLLLHPSSFIIHLFFVFSQMPHKRLKAEHSHIVSRGGLFFEAGPFINGLAGYCGGSHYA
jgi:hypothetical protein